MKSYGQFCPVAKACEVVGERWTPLIIRELLCGSQSFNDIRSGVPLMSPSLLSSRLKMLEHSGIVERQENKSGIVYSLTEAGQALHPIIFQLGVWGKRWVRSELSKDDLDPRLLMWDVHRRIDVSLFPAQRTVLLFEFTDYTSKLRRWWLIVDKNAVDICLKDPGYAIDLHLLTDVQCMTLIWMGELGISKAQRQKRLKISGTPALKNELASWLGLSMFANVKPPPN